MKSLILALAMLLGLAVGAHAHGPIVVRRTPFRPFVGPVAVRGFNNGFNGSRGFVSPSFSRGVIVDPGFGSRGIYGGNVVVDQFGRTIILR